MPEFIYCLNSSTIKPVPILDKIAIAAETGYAAIELWHDDIDAYLRRGGTLGEIRKAVDDRGLTVPTTIFLKGWWDTTGDVYRRAMDENKRRMEQAAAVGTVHCIAGPPLGMVDRALGPRQYRALLEAGLQLGVKPSVEYLGFAEEINRIEDALEIAAGSGHADATVVLDPFHCFRGGGSIEAIRQLRPEQIAISHFNDTPAFPPRELQHDPDRVLPGDGHLDLKRYVALLREIGYRGCLSLEVFNRELWAQNPREVARVGLEKMRAAVER
jgi:2-keto-myo-inositol isomerase